jgi:hypothetical protein
MAWTIIRNVNHSRKIGEKNGKAQYISTQIGVIIRDENGVEKEIRHYEPCSDGSTFLNKPKKKEEEAPF